MLHSSPKKNGYEKTVPKGNRISVGELCGSSLLQLPAAKKSLVPFLDYFDLFFAFFFFAFGTEITCRHSVALDGLTLPTTPKFCTRCLFCE
jgi:hypothetical protein